MRVLGKYNKVVFHDKMQQIVRLRCDQREGGGNSPSYKEFEFTYIPDIGEVKKTITEYWNAECVQEIQSCMQYQGAQVWLSAENQLTYKTFYLLAFERHLLNLPFESPVIKLGDEFAPQYITFKNFEELSQFTSQCAQHIQNVLSKYRVIKDGIKWDDYNI